MAGTDYEIKNLSFVNIKIKYSFQFKIRGWIALKLMKLAAWISGAMVEFDEVKDE